MIAAAPPRLQRLIIAALETGCRLGELLKLQWQDVDLDRRELPTPARLISTAQRSPADLVSLGRFDDRLLYRLNVFEITLPPLRERHDDLPLMAAHFLKEYFNLRRKEPPALSPAVLQLFGGYPWPGNVGELRSACEQIAQTCTCDAVHLGCVPPPLLLYTYVKARDRLASPNAYRSAVSTDEQSKEVESNLIRWALKISNGNKSKAAELLNIDLVTLDNRIEKLGL